MKQLRHPQGEGPNYHVLGDYSPVGRLSARTTTDIGPRFLQSPTRRGVFVKRATFMCMPDRR